MRSTFTRALAVAVAASVAACNTDHMSVGTGGGMHVLLTDAPFPYDQVSRVDVYIVRVEATANADTTTAQTWQTLVEPDKSFNLLDVQNGATALLGDAQVDAGRLAMIRLVIRTDLSSVTLTGGDRAAVNWSGPATQTVNALIEQPLSLTTGGSGNLIVDFDVGRSFVALPGGAFQFLPWIRAVNQDATGSISGIVTGSDGGAPAAPVARASVTVYRSAGSSLMLAATGVTDAQGRYTIHYVSGGGPYTVEATPPQGYQATPGFTHDVMVTPGQESAADVALSDGSAPSGSLEILGPSSVAVGNHILLAARVSNALGDSVLGAPVTWSVLDPAVAALESNAGSAVLVTGLAAGSARVVASSNALADTVTVTVGVSDGSVATVDLSPDTATVPVGDTTALIVVARDAFGTVLSGRTVTWSFDPGVLHDAGHNNDYIIIRGIAAGTTYVKATVEGQADSTRVSVQ